MYLHNEKIKHNETKSVNLINHTVNIIVLSKSLTSIYVLRFPVHMLHVVYFRLCTYFFC